MHEPVPDVDDEDDEEHDRRDEEDDHDEHPAVLTAPAAQRELEDAAHEHPAP